VFTAYFALVVFLLVYVCISTEKINKTIAALFGAGLFIIAGVVSQESLFDAIDWNVIFLLVSMMIIVNIIKTTGVFQYIAIKTAKAVRGDPVKILVLISLVTAVFSAFLDNVTTVLILSPVIILIAVELGVSPVPFILCSAIASNIGGTSTLIGDPPNIMIGSAAKLGFVDFIVNLGPVIIIILAVFSLVIVLFFRKQLRVSNERKARIMEFDEAKSIEDKPLMIKSLCVLVLVLLGFVFHGFLNLEASAIAMSGAALLLIISGRKDPDDFFKDVEWTTIFFFIGLFILVDGLVGQGWMKKCTKLIVDATAGNMKTTSVLLIWASGLLSAVVDNIPYVATMIPILKDIHAGAGPGGDALWWALSLGACLGGNGTLIGASANVVSSNISAKNGYPISFIEFTKYGALITIINLAICTVYVLLKYFA